MSDGSDQETFNEMVRLTIERRLRRLDSEELLNTLGFLIQRERRKSADEAPVGLYPIS